MVNTLLYFFSFILTKLGFLLGKSTQDEHLEVKRFVIVLVDLLKILFFIILLVLFVEFYVVIGVYFLFFVLWVVLQVYKKDGLLELYTVFLFSFTFIILSMYNKEINVILILVFALILENSFKRFSFKKEATGLLVYIFVYLLWFLFL